MLRKIIGFDPASVRNLGWSRLMVDDTTPRECDAGTFVIPKVDEPWQALWPIWKRVDGFLGKEKPDLVVEIDGEEIPINANGPSYVEGEGNNSPEHVKQWPAPSHEVIGNDSNGSRPVNSGRAVAIQEEQEATPDHGTITVDLGSTETQSKISFRNWLFNIRDVRNSVPGDLTGEHDSAANKVCGNLDSIM